MLSPGQEWGLFPLCAIPVCVRQKKKNNIKIVCQTIAHNCLIKLFSLSALNQFVCIVLNNATCSVGINKLLKTPANDFDLYHFRLFAVTTDWGVSSPKGCCE